MLSMSAGKFMEIGITQFGGISALLRKQIMNTKLTTQIPNEFEVVQKNNQKSNDKKPKEKTIQNFFSQQSTSNSTRKCKDEASQSNGKEVLQNKTAKSLENLSCEKNKTAKTIQSFFATKQKQMNCTKKDCDLLRDFEFQTKLPSNRQTQDTNNTALTTHFKSSSVILKDSMEAESEAIENRIPFSKSLPESKDLSRSRLNNSEDCIILLSDNETSDGDSCAAENSHFNKDIFQNTNLLKMKNTSGSTILSHNELEIKQIKLTDEDNNKVDVNKSMIINDSAPNIHQTTITTSTEENSNKFPNESDIDIYFDKETEPDISIPMTSNSEIYNDNTLTDVEKKSGLTHPNSGIFSKCIFNSVCDSGNGQMSLEALDYVTCEECQKKVLVWDFEEHQDFHFAQKLQKSVNVEAKHLSHVVPTPLSWTTKKRKGKILQPTHTKKNKTKGNIQTLEVFFKK